MVSHMSTASRTPCHLKVDHFVCMHRLHRVIVQVIMPLPRCIHATCLLLQAMTLARGPYRAEARALQPMEGQRLTRRMRSGAEYGGAEYGRPSLP